jgi:CRP-like cAMP-binding protein
MNSQRNRVLASFSASDRGRLELDLEHCRLEKRDILDRPNEPIEHIYFPESGIGSVIALDDVGRRIEVGPFGREGMSGTPVVLGAASCPLETSVQVEGIAYRIKTTALRQAMAESPSLHRRLLLYVQAFHIQTAQTLLVNSFANVEQRLARWLLMSHDRLDHSDRLPLTHEFIAEMLGVRRAGVTEAVQMLEGRLLIRASRGLIEVRDREGLQNLAGRSYGASEAEYARLFTS